MARRPRVQNPRRPDPDPAPAQPATGPKISDIPSNYAGNPLIAASNVAKLEKAAATGSVDALEQAAAAIKAKKIGYLKKAAINKAVQALEEQMAKQAKSGTGQRHRYVCCRRGRQRRRREASQPAGASSGGRAAAR